MQNQNANCEPINNGPKKINVLPSFPTYKKIEKNKKIKKTILY
jgi:hypothetical protein